ncbi:hypothetical protein BRD56_05300 [Thermoplasmatales archaeon SW_10_69_26]|nr:MAG: hypothetical protein BRD56_05300 [Thermoplasmatales archaeon SW_10_69_26]
MGVHTFVIETDSTIADTDALEDLVKLLEDHDDVGAIKDAGDFHDTVAGHLLGRDGPPELS